MRKDSLSAFIRVYRKIRNIEKKLREKTPLTDHELEVISKWDDPVPADVLALYALKGTSWEGFAELLAGWQRLAAEEAEELERWYRLDVETKIEREDN